MVLLKQFVHFHKPTKREKHMSDSNPFAPPSTSSLLSNSSGPRKVSFAPIALYKRSYALMGEQYWLFVGITLVGILLGSLVPFGILMGPMMVGIYLCFADRERGKQVEFGTLFKGFDHFANSFIAVLIIMVASFLVLIPILIVMTVVMITALPSNGGNQVSPLAIPIILLCYLVMIIAVFLIQLPFLFTFQLIADRGLTGPQAVGMSFKALQKNFGGCILLSIVIGLLSILASLACYVPVFFLMPITMGVLFLAYRDIFGPSSS